MLARRLLVISLATAAVLAGAGCGPAPTSESPTTPSAGSSPAHSPLEESVSGSDRLVTNEFAHWNPRSPEAVKSTVWDVTSGSLFVRNGVGWSGVPDHGTVDARSSTDTDSGTFRGTLRGTTDRDVTFSGRFRLVAITPAAGSPSTSPAASPSATPTGDDAWHGLHLWLRHRSPQDLYAVSFARADGQVTIKRKTPGGTSNGGTYRTLAQAPGGLTPGDWHDVSATVEDEDGGVRITLTIDGREALSALDPGGDRDQTPGTVGMRGDDAEFEMTGLTVTAA